MKYYLDQAYKCQMIGANSACISMYRAALEQILYNDGYKKGMLQTKIENLEKAIKNHTAKEWTKNIDEELFKYIKDLGNGSIHPNNGDVSKQKTFDDKLMIIIDMLFKEFLDAIYEKPIQEKNRKDLLQNAARSFHK